MLRQISIGLLFAVVVGALLYRTFGPPSDPKPTAEFGGVSLRLDYATSTEAQERGLSGRTNLPANYGMLFVFEKDGRYGFWMKDMLVPVDIFWLNGKRQVVAISQNVSTSTYPYVFYPPEPVRYVLETAAGFARDHAIATGTALRLINP